MITFSLLVFLFTGSVPHFSITCDPDQFQYMMENWDQEITIDCAVEHLGVVYEGCTLRIRGDTSRIFPKKSYRIEFPAEHPLGGHTAWNFNADYLDHSYMRSWLFARVLSEMNFPCFRVSHAVLSVNGDNRGVFMMTEPLNSDFLTENGFAEGGNLYKAARDGACFTRYDDLDSMWAKKTNTSSGMNDLVSLINKASSSDLEGFGLLLDSTFVMQGNSGLIRMLAVNSVFANNSTYYHNYYLYHDVENTGRWTMLPWDVDKVLTKNLAIGYGAVTNLNWYDNPLNSRVLSIPRFRGAFIDSVETIFSTCFTEEKLQTWVDSLQTELEEEIALDSCDATDPAGFIEAGTELLANYATRRDDLYWQFQHKYFPFESLPSDTVSTGNLEVRWHQTEDPHANPATYSVVVRDHLGAGAQEVLRIDGIQDTTCVINNLRNGNYWWTVETDPQAGWRITEAEQRYNPFTVVEPSLLSGTLGQNTTLYRDFSPYLIQGEITVPQGGVLTIQSGVTVLAASDGAINCEGNLVSMGSVSDSVFIIPENSSTGWRGIRVNGGSVQFQYTCLSGSRGYSSSPGTDFAALSGHSASVILENSTFRRNNSCVKLVSGTARVDDCRFVDNRGELFYMENGESATISGSDFINLHDPVASSMDGIEFSLCSEGEFVVENCVVDDIDGDCIDMNSSTVTIKNTRLGGSTDKGLSVGAPTGGSGSGSLVSLENCVVVGCPIGAGVKDSAALQGTGIVFYGCDKGVYCYEKTSGMGGGIVCLSNSVFSQCAEPLRVDMGFAEVDWSVSDTRSLPGQGNLNADPLLTEDFYPEWNSPCIDSGDPSEKDPDGSRRDMGAYFFPVRMNRLVVNELMALNSVTVQDDWGRYSDWIEIYNGEDYDIDAGVLVFYDSGSCRAEPWSVARGTMIPAGGFALFWADGDGWKGGTHLPFRLSGNGDGFTLGRTVPGTTPRVFTLDQVVFEPQTPDVSIGRFPDGGEWRILETPTPGYTNGSSYNSPVVLGSPYPNPCRVGLVQFDLTVAGGLTEVFVYDLVGRKIDTLTDGTLSRGTHRLEWNTTAVPSGLYFVFARCAGQLSAAARVTVLN